MRRRSPECMGRATASDTWGLWSRVADRAVSRPDRAASFCVDDCWEQFSL